MSHRDINDDNAPLRRLWVVIHKYYPLHTGAVLLNRRILSRLPDYGYQVEVLTPEQRTRSSREVSTIVFEGVLIRYLSVFPKVTLTNPRIPLYLRKLMSYISDIFFSWSFGLRSAWELLRRGHKNELLCLVSFSSGSFLPIWVARLRGMNSMIQLTLVESDDPVAVSERLRRGLLTDLGARQALRGSDSMVALSTALYERSETEWLKGHQVSLIPIGVDVSLFKPLESEERQQLRANLGLDPQRRYVIFVGFPIYRKGIDVLVRSFLQVAARVEDADLLILGDLDFADSKKPELLVSLQDEIEAAGCTDRVFWLGYVENEQEYKQYLQAADIFQFPTRREGLPQVVGEAMACGLPVVTARLEGVTTDFITTDQMGVLIEGHDPDDYADAITRLLTDIDQAAKLGQAAREQIEKHFSLERVVREYANLYESLGADRAR